MTNGDRIRQMTDEDLVRMIDMRVCRIVKPDGKDCPKGFYFGKCNKCILKWLKQEVNEDASRDAIKSLKKSEKFRNYEFIIINVEVWETREDATD